tara:strand:+ start:1056 stop:1364 length:309 start_codon:yes stop_codon:yes gene_type:complete
MSKHTPGPWRVKYESEPGGAFLIYGPWGGAIDPDADYVTQEENEANCRLIAAAPELLAALERTLSNAIGHACDARGDDCNFEDWPWVQQAREAIASARKEEA